MSKLSFRPTASQLAMHWFATAALLLGALSIYVFVFWLPYRSLDLSKCPSACSQNSDCWVPGCSKKTECHNAKCQTAVGHKLFLTASFMGLFFILAAFWGFVSFIKTKTRMEIDDEGVRFIRPFWEIEIPWEKFLGITYHGVNTRLGSNATVYSLAGDTGLFSYIVKGLPENTSTRELELGALFFLHLSKEQHEQLVAFIEEKAGVLPEAEYEW